MYIDLSMECEDIDLIVLSLEDTKKRLSDSKMKDEDVLENVIDNAIININRIQERLNDSCKKYIDEML